MKNEEAHNIVTSDEQLARFILRRRDLRSDLTVKPDPFIPHPYSDLSVTRHLQLSDRDLWSIGREIARQTSKSLCGRADILVSDFERHRLQVIVAPIDSNPNHANVVGWPLEKPAQKSIAQQIAAAAGKAKKPPEVEN